MMRKPVEESVRLGGKESILLCFVNYCTDFFFEKDVILSSFLNNLFYTYCANVNSLVINVQTCIK